jgi:hypothetical protein
LIEQASVCSSQGVCFGQVGKRKDIGCEEN